MSNFELIYIKAIDVFKNMVNFFKKYVRKLASYRIIIT